MWWDDMDDSRAVRRANSSDSDSDGINTFSPPKNDPLWVKYMQSLALRDNPFVSDSDDYSTLEEKITSPSSAASPNPSELVRSLFEDLRRGLMVIQSEMANTTLESCRCDTGDLNVIKPTIVITPAVCESQQDMDKEEMVPVSICNTSAWEFINPWRLPFSVKLLRSGAKDEMMVCAFWGRWGATVCID